jgi:hypothetical protein
MLNRVPIVSQSVPREIAIANGPPNSNEGDARHRAGSAPDV